MVNTEENELSNYVSAIKFNTIPDSVLIQIKNLVVDFFGVTLAGSATPQSKIIVEVVKSLGGNEQATIIGNSFKTSVINAALANGTSCHSIELDDIHEESFLHVSSTVIPAAIAVSELLNVNGKILIEGILAGFESSIRVAKSINPSHRLRGYHTTATCGCIGSAMAVSKILNLSPERIQNALGLSVTQAGGLFQGAEEGDMSKRFHAGRASMAGVLAALLAQKNYLASKNSIGGKYGLGKVLTDDYKPELITKDLYKKFEIMNVGFKMHASCRFTHPCIDITLYLKNEHNIIPEEIKEIDVWLSKLGVDQLNIKRPKTVMSAQLSVQYSIALAIVKGKTSYIDYQKNLNNPLVMKLASKVKLYVDNNISSTSRTSTVSINTSRGNFLKQLDYCKGEPENPMSQNDIKKKFHSLAGFILTNSKIDELHYLILNLENVNTIDMINKIH